MLFLCYKSMRCKYVCIFGVVGSSAPTLHIIKCNEMGGIYLNNRRFIKK